MLNRDLVAVVERGMLLAKAGDGGAAALVPGSRAIAPGGKVKNAKAKKATKATKKVKRASGEKPATALDRAGDAKPLAKLAVPSHLRSKVGKPDGETFGRTTGLRVVHFADALLRHNEKAKATDPELNATFAAEFPRRHSKESGVQGVKTLQTIAAFRSYHNAGKHGCDGGLGDGHRSHSYNAEGVAREATASKGKGKGKGKGKAKKAK